MEIEDPKHSRIHYLKHRLGIFRIPLGIFFLLLAFILIITPLTPGSMFALIAGLELLDLREHVFKWFKRKQK